MNRRLFAIFFFLFAILAVVAAPVNLEEDICFSCLPRNETHLHLPMQILEARAKKAAVKAKPVAKPKPVAKVRTAQYSLLCSLSCLCSPLPNPSRQRSPNQLQISQSQSPQQNQLQRQ
jgi:hypothetical protein